MTFTVRMSNGDIDIDSTGGQTLIENDEKAAQDVADSILMPYDGERGYGNEMFDSTGTLRPTLGNPIIGRQAVNIYVTRAITRLIQYQARAIRLPAAEKIEKIKSLVVRPGNRVTDFSFFLAVELLAAAPVETAFNVQLAHLGIPDEGALGGLAPSP